VDIATSGGVISRAHRAPVVQGTVQLKTVCADISHYLCESDFEEEEREKHPKARRERHTPYNTTCESLNPEYESAVVAATQPPQQQS
tara:strand:- start:323 stop:583 length:261 start_codon:yes stop_codon:yes gene_type:complete